MLFQLLGGVLFRPIYYSVLLILMGSQIGIIISTFIGKSFLRPYVVNLYRTNRKIRAVDFAIKNDGLKVVILLRLTPIFPFGVFNYILSGTCLNFKQIMIGSLIGTLPGSILHSILGSLIGDLADSETRKTPIRIQALTWLFSITFTVCAFIIIGIIARKALRGVVDFETPDDEPTIEIDINDSPIEQSRLDTEIQQVFGEENQFLENNNNFTKNEIIALWAVPFFAFIALAIGIPVIILKTPELIYW
jgi:uncharacterized membrane protein YdjX (TVP38/TMEM64 family)